jgi:branched-chain amino acid aminotransferase
MPVSLYQITKKENLLLASTSLSLDEKTRELPQGFYTTFNTLEQGTKVLGLSAHLQRLYNPARELGLISSVEEETLRSDLAALIKENLPKESRLRLILSRETGSVYVLIEPFVPLPEFIYQKGVRVITSSMYRHDPRIKNTGFITETVSERKSISNEIFEILLTKKGQILEGMTSNFYAVKEGGTLQTAKLGILPGVTRKAVLKLARGQGMPIEYRAPWLKEKFNEAFLTSSSRGIVPIVFIDSEPVGQGKVGKWTTLLSRAYQDHIRERSEKIVV